MSKTVANLPQSQKCPEIFAESGCLPSSGPWRYCDRHARLSLSQSRRKGPLPADPCKESEDGEERTFTSKALNPGIYVYHCAVPPVALHIANGMYGLILVEPEDGLEPVDREFYVMQGELYTEEPFATAGLLTESYDKLINERPEYFVFKATSGLLPTIIRCVPKLAKRCAFTSASAAPILVRP